MSRRTTVVKQLKASGTQMLLLDGGNALFAALPRNPDTLRLRQAVEKAKVIISAYNRMGYHALAVGDTELGVGLAELKELERLMKFPLLCANLVAEEGGSPAFTPSAIVTIGSIKVGLFGLIMNTLNPQYLQGVAPGVKLIDGLEAGKRVAAELRPQVDLVVGLCHSNDDENRKLLSQCPAIDMIVDPYCFSGNHTLWLEEEKYLDWVDGKALLRCDAQGSRFGKFDILMGEIGKPFVPWATFQNAQEKKEAGEELGEDGKQVLRDAKVRHLGGIEVVPIYPHFAEAPEIKAMVDRFRASTRFVEVEIGEEEEKAKQRYLTAEACKECHAENHARWRKTLHGRAYGTLAKSGDEFRYDCLPCHAIGYGETFLDARAVGPYKDVQCESCHGTNPGHAKAPEANRWPKIEPVQCLVCHNPEHLGEPFDFDQMVAKDTCCAVK